MADGLSSRGVPLVERGVSEDARGTSKAPHRIGAAPTATPTATPKNAWQKGRAKQKARKPVWQFTVAAWVTQETAYQYRDRSALKKLVEEQLLSVTFRFNFPETLNGTLRLVLNDLQVFTGNSVDRAAEPHPQSDYVVVYDSFPTDVTDWGGGFYAPYRAIHHAWDRDSEGGIFGEHATNGLVHEFGHARGAIQLSDLAVPRETNSITGTSYDPGPSYMHHFRDVRMWDDHSIHIINVNANATDNSVYDITRFFPAGIDIFAVDASARPLPNVDIALYPVRWRTNSVDPSPTVTGSTGPQSRLHISGHPFGTAGNDTTYCNFLVVATRGASKAHDWLPLTAVQEHFFLNPHVPNAQLAVVMP